MFKTRFISILALLLTVTQGAWAQTTADIGRVIAADGKMYKTVTLANKVSTASGVVVYVGSTSKCVCPDYPDDRVLVLAVNNTGYKVWGSDGCTHGGTYDSESAAITHLSGNVTTFMLYNEHISTSSGHHTHQPAYDCRTLNVAKPSGAHEWFMPSAGQWNLMVKGLTGSNTNLSNTENSALAYDKLNAKISTAAGAQALASSNYMLSTSRSTNEYWEYLPTGKLAHIGSKNTYGFYYRAMFTMTSGHSNGYVVEYNANGGSGAPAAQSKTHGTALTLSSTVPTRDGYTFAGWATSAEGAVAYSAGGSYTTDNDIVLYAQWTPVTYTATFATGTEDAEKWTITPNEATTTGVAAGTTVTATYSGTKKVKSVKAVKKAPAIPLDNTTTAWSAGTYAVPAGGLTYSDAITVSGNVTLVLTDGETLTLNKGISLASGATLTIQGNGTMNVNGTNNSTASTVAGTGTLVLTSGTLTAKGGNGGNVGDMNDGGHGGAGGAAISGSVTVKGGTLTATGGNGGNVGDDVYEGHGGAGGAAISGSVTVNGGTLTAAGGKGGSVGSYSDECSGGAGGAAIGGSLTINAGTMTTTNGAAGSVGSDCEGSSGGAAGNAVAGTVTDNR